MKLCPCGCGLEVPPPKLQRAKKKVFFNEAHRRAFEKKAFQIGRERLLRQARKKGIKGIKKNATPAERLGSLAAMAREVLGTV